MLTKFSKCLNPGMFFICCPWWGHKDTAKAVLWLESFNMAACHIPVLQKCNSISFPVVVAIWFRIAAPGALLKVSDFFFTSISGFWGGPFSPATGLLFNTSSFWRINVWYYPKNCSKARNLCLRPLRAITSEQSSKIFLISSKLNTSCSQCTFYD